MKRRDFLVTATGASVAGAVTGSVALGATDPPVPEEAGQWYKCEICATIVEVIEPDIPSLVHCGKPMLLLEELTEDLGREKHVPVIEKTAGGYKVKCGDIPHPMTEEHLVTVIELSAPGIGMTYRKTLKPGEAPEAVFITDAAEVTARAYCNLHGLWKSS
jgi:superoxide reductase